MTILNSRQDLERSGFDALSSEVETLIGGELLFSLLARLLLAYPKREFLETIIADELFEEIPLNVRNERGDRGLALLVNWSRQRDRTLSEYELINLREDYTRLFEGPGHVLAPPWESVHVSMTGLTFQEETLAVRQWYRSCGLEPVKLNTEPDDHVGLELSFLAYLIGKTVEARDTKDANMHSHYLEAQLRFINEHLGCWIGPWANKVQEGARTTFWPGVALLAEGAVVFWRDLLNEYVLKTVV